MPTPDAIKTRLQKIIRDTTQLIDRYERWSAELPEDVEPYDLSELETIRTAARDLVQELLELRRRDALPPGCPACPGHWCLKGDFHDRNGRGFCANCSATVCLCGCGESS